MKNPLLFLLLPCTFMACEKGIVNHDPLLNQDHSCEVNTYCFTRAGETTVDYSGQTARLKQLEELSAYMKLGNAGFLIEAAQMIEMFSNNEGAGSDFFSSDAAIAGKQLKNKCFLGTLGNYETWMTELAAISGSSAGGENGVAGVLTSINDPSKAYLFNANGFEYAQLIEKGLMGDVFYYQAMSTYIDGTENGSFNTSDLMSGENYTEAEHKFDEAFGYFGIPINFPSNTDESRFYGRYCNQRDAALGSNAIMEDWMAARRSITLHEDVLPHTEQVRYHWHRVIAGCTIHYLNRARQDINDPAMKLHELSEAWAFIGNLLHSAPEFALTVEEVEAARGLLGENLYATNSDDIDACILYLLDRTEIELSDLPNL